jgi:catechol 2,3-dioxygenase-like lactoylglutathione lyase family enzyme
MPFLSVIPKLPMRDLRLTQSYYEQLGFRKLGLADFPEYLMMKMDELELHFFLHPTLDPRENDGQIYFRVTEIDQLYAQYIALGVQIHPHGALSDLPWGQRSFSLLDPDHNLITFGQHI